MDFEEILPRTVTFLFTTLIGIILVGVGMIIYYTFIL